MLSDEQTRARYDRFGHAGVDGASLHTDQFMDFGSLSDLLGAFFGDDIFRAEAARPQAAATDGAVELTLAEAAFGVTREVGWKWSQAVTLRRTGAEPGHEPERCPECGGRAVCSTSRRRRLASSCRHRLRRVRRARRRIDSPCSECRGRGRRPSGAASRCRCRPASIGASGCGLPVAGHEGERRGAATST